MLSRCLLLLCLLGLTIEASAQVRPSYYDYVRPDLAWYTIETEHFKVIFHADAEGRGSSRTAQVVARVAEDIYGPITSLYEHRPGSKVSIILKDYEDYSNGAAYFFDNKIEIWAPALDAPLRGDHSWLRNVIAHEFTHIVQVQKAMKAGRQLPFVYFQLLGYEDVKRPDVLYGYPNILVTYPIATLNNPAWLAEGTAQYQRTALDYDRWDTHRDMLLRTRVLAGAELSLAEMGGFYSHSSLLREGVYNHGYAFTHYLAGTYGEDALRKISEQLGRWGNWNAEQAMHDALGVSGSVVYQHWMETLRGQYEQQTASIRAHLVEGPLYEAEGFSNFYPRFSPGGERLAYVSNRGEDFNLMSLYVRDLASGAWLSYGLDGLTDGETPYTCALGRPLKSQVGGAVSWRPDGKAIAYASTKDTPEGYLYADLYELDLDAGKARRLTQGQRAVMPAYAPDGKQMAFVGQGDGSTNLWVLDLDTEQSRRLTSFDDGTQVSDPAWHPHGSWIYFSLFGDGSRDLYRIRPDGSAMEAVVATPSDERSPAPDPTGTYLYYSSDASGIFNLYRLSLEGDGEAERLTNVLGGAFMPAVSPDGKLAFAQYQWDGYKIALFNAVPTLPDAARLDQYTPPPITQKQGAPALASAEWTHLNAFDDTDLRPLATEALTAVRTEGSFPLSGQRGEAEEGQDETEALEVKPYGDTFTAFSIFPVLRFDQYVSSKQSRADVRVPDRNRGELLLRNTKVGVYVASREVLEGLSMLGGLLVGPASKEAASVGDFFAPDHLLELERDLFVQFEYKKGFSFLPERWSPQLAFELFNVRRNVENGLSVEEFTCTACVEPETSFVDLAYDLFEANLAARSKVSRSLLLELGYRYSPYRVTTDPYFSRELQLTIPGSTARYYISHAFRAKAYLEALHPYRQADVVPEGVRVEAGYEYEPGRLLSRFGVEDGALVPRYDQYDVHRLTFDARVGLRLGGAPLGGAHGVGVRFRASTILGGAVDDFFNDYVGGLVGARGYPFYALGGNETLWLQMAYHFPILPDLKTQVLFAYLDKLYGRVYADAAAAWTGAWPGFGEVRKDVGVELRMSVGSFYLLPTAVFLSATYSPDVFVYQLDSGFLTPDGSNIVSYGKELLWHFGVLFEFDL